MTQLALILLLVAVLGAAAVTAGVALLAGPGWALVTGGGLALAAGVALLDPSELRGSR